MFAGLGVVSWATYFSKSDEDDDDESDDEYDDADLSQQPRLTCSFPNRLAQGPS